VREANEGALLNTTADVAALEGAQAHRAHNASQESLQHKIVEDEMSLNQKLKVAQAKKELDPAFLDRMLRKEKETQAIQAQVDSVRQEVRNSPIRTRTLREHKRRWMPLSPLCQMRSRVRSRPR